MSHRRDKTKYNDSLSWNSWIFWDSYHLQCLAMRFSGTERVDGLLKAVHSHLCVRRHRQPFSPAQTVQESCHVASMRQPMQFQDQTSRPRSASRRGPLRSEDAMSKMSGVVPKTTSVSRAAWLAARLCVARLVEVASTRHVYLPLWKIWKSVGMMKFPIYGKSKPCSKPPTSMIYMVIHRYHNRISNT